VDVGKSDAELQAAIASGPVSVGVAANNNWFSYQSGVMTIADCPAGQIDHGVVAVG